MKGSQKSLAEKILGLSLLDRKSRILEVSCGDGECLSLMKESTGASVFGIDLSAETLRERKEKDQSLNLLCAATGAFPFKRESFDFAYMVDALPFLKDWKLTLREILEILKKRGEVCIVTHSHRRNEEQFLRRYFPSLAEAPKRRQPGVYRIAQALKESGCKNLEREIWEGEILSGISFLHSVEGRSHPELSMVPENEFKEGLDKLKSEIGPGSLFRVSRYTLIRGRK